MTDWADDRARCILRLLKLATEQEAHELLAAALRAVDATGAARGVTQLAEGLSQRFGRLPNEYEAIAPAVERCKTGETSNG